MSARPRSRGAAPGFELGVCILLMILFAACWFSRLVKACWLLQLT